MRYLPLSDADREAMLQRIGADRIDDLFADVPADKLLKQPLDLPAHLGELEVEQALAALAAKNVSAGAVPFFVGAGAYRHHLPATVDHLVQRSEFLTSYTPYQPEISQGTLQALFEFQTQVALLTGMEVANASMYDGSTGCGEAVLMAERLTRRGKAVISGSLHPHYRAVIENVCRFAEHEVVALPADPEGKEDIVSQIDDDTACIVVQSPGVYGNLTDLAPLAEAAHEKGALLVAIITEIVSLGAVKSPGEMGADIVAAEGQSLGNALNFGGPYLGLFATREKFVRQMPGRLAGETVDVDGRRGYVLTLSTREQHIRRERATSNICTNSGLCALAFSIHVALLGDKGLKRLAQINHAKAVRLADALSAVKGVEIVTPTFFNEFTIRLPGDGAEVVEKLAGKGVLGGVPVSRLEPEHDDLANLLILAATETNSDADLEAYAAALKEVLK